MFLIIAIATLALANPLEFRARVQEHESAVVGLKPGNQARVDLIRGKEKTKTPYVFLNIHGFSASPKELSPLVEDLAQSFKSHSYFIRLDGHGLARPLEGVRLETWQEQVREAISASSELGKELIVIGTSTGAAVLASVLENTTAPIRAVIFVSPFFGSPHWHSHLLLIPGLGDWLAQMFFGKIRTWTPQNPRQNDYWSTSYPAEATVQPVRAARAARAVDYDHWKIPTLIAVNPADPIIDLKVAKKIYDRISVPKEWLSVPESENHHIIAGNITSPNGTKKMNRFISNFLKHSVKLLN